LFGIAARVDRKEQSIVLLNRRGFATAVFCRQCSGTIDCPNCSVSRVVHGEGAARWSRCHYCNYSARVPAACPTCKAPYLEQMGFAPSVEAQVKKQCPMRAWLASTAPTRRKGSLVALLAVQAGEIDVRRHADDCEGHDFPRHPVGVVWLTWVSAWPTSRASERTFQLLTQAGRAGRGNAGRGDADDLPDALQHPARLPPDYAAFYEREMLFRKAMRYPPTVSLIIGRAGDACHGRRLQYGDAAAGPVARQPPRAGPAPAPLGKLRGGTRAVAGEGGRTAAGCETSPSSTRAQSCGAP
jgi:primosomal protein N' (replication factor Y)